MKLKACFEFLNFSIFGADEQYERLLVTPTAASEGDGEDSARELVGFSIKV